MSLSLGMMAEIRSLTFIAGEPLPLFWPMRSFIHHNPLQGLEKLTFEDAVVEGKRLFHGSGFLPRKTYQSYLLNEKISMQSLSANVGKYVSQNEVIDDIDLHHWLMTLLTELENPFTGPESNCARSIASDTDVGAVLRGESLSSMSDSEVGELSSRLCGRLTSNSPLYEALDSLFDTGIGLELDELVIRSCLDYFDEGQSVWSMPNRKNGFYAAWREVSLRNLGLVFKGRRIREILADIEEPEEMIVYVMETLKIPKQQWMRCFRRELARLHGWAGFIRWRSNARHYHHGVKYPGDLVDFLAVRLAIALSLIQDRARKGIPGDRQQLDDFIKQQPMQTYLRQQLFSQSINPGWAQRVEQSILSGDSGSTEELGYSYLHGKRERNAKMQADSIVRLAELAGSENLDSISDNDISSLLSVIRDFEQHEGMLWLESMESTAMNRLLGEFQLDAPVEREKRPFAQAMFCIDVRSERYRRHLESIGDYQTFGIAGFFGVPVSFVELGKGTESHLCPVLLTPKNLVMEMSVDEPRDKLTFTVLEKAVHKLKETILSPFVTVEAIGWIFGFDMVGKTLAPRRYNSWRECLHEHKPHTHLLIDKLSREKADSMVRAVQRAVIAQAIEHEFGITPEQINDDMVRELREAAMDHELATPLFQQKLQIDREGTLAFIKSLRDNYHISVHDARSQMERLGRIGFSLKEQVDFVSQALHAIGLVKNFSRFILVAAHGSQSENNPYESALDCGACGGNLGIFNARIFAHMANKPAIRKRLQQQGIDIPDDSWFVPAMHNTTTDEVELHDLDLLPSSHPIYLDRLRTNLVAASALSAQERIPTLDLTSDVLPTIEKADKQAMRNAMDWSQVRPEWGLSRNVYFIIGRRSLTKTFSLEGRAFLHSYDYRVDSNLRLLENIMTGPLVVGQWINMEHYFSTVDNENYGSGSKVYHNVAGRFGVMTGNLSDLRTGLPAQTVLADGEPYHEPMRLITVIEAPLEHVVKAINRVASVRGLMKNGWIRVLIRDPQTGITHINVSGEWQVYDGELNSSENVDSMNNTEAHA